MEEEHRKIISQKMRLAVHKQLHSNVDKENTIPKTDVEMLDRDQNKLNFEPLSSGQVSFTNYFLNSKLILYIL